MCASIPAGSTGPAAAAGGGSSVPGGTGNVGVASSNPTLLQSRPPKKEVAKEEPRDENFDLGIFKGHKTTPVLGGEMLVFFGESVLTKLMARNDLKRSCELFLF